MRVAAVPLLLSVAALSSCATAAFLDCPKTAKSTDDCDYNTYGNSVIGLVGPGIICAVLTLLFLPLFYLGRCCGCCGGTNQTSGCFCGGGPARYSVADVIRPKLYTLVLLGMGIGITIAGLVGSGQFVTGVYDFIDSLEATPDRMYAEVVKLNSSFEYETYNSDTDTVGLANPFAESDALKSLDEMRNSTKEPITDLTTQLRDYLSQFDFVTFIIFSLPCAFVGLGAFSALCNIRTCIPCLSGCLFMFLSVLLWIIFAAFIAFAFVFGDLSVEVGAIANGDRSVLIAMAECKDDQFVELRSSFVDIESNTAAQACQMMADMCYLNSQSVDQNVAQLRVYDCGSGFSCTNVRFGDIVDIMEKVMKIHATIKGLSYAKDRGLTCADSSLPCYVAECASDCKLSSTGALSESGKNSKTAIYTFRGAQKVTNALDTLAGEYGSCQTIFALLAGPFSSPLKTIYNGMFTIAQAAGFGCVSSIMFVYIMSWGSKRFMSLSDLRPEDPDKDIGVMPQ